MGKIFAIQNAKGGVGKTQTTLSLAGAAEEAGYTCLVVDVDMQANATTGLGIKPDPKYNIGRFMVGQLENFEDMRYEDVLKKSGLISVLPSHESITDREKEMYHDTDRDLILKSVLDELKEHYDYIFIDCSPTINLYTFNALVAADYVIIPHEAASWSYDGIEKVLRQVQKAKKKYNPALEVAGLLFTQASHNTRTLIGKDIITDTQALLTLHQIGERIFDTVIRTDIRLEEAAHTGKHIFRYEKEKAMALTKGAEDYQNLFTKEIKIINQYGLKEKYAATAAQ